ncbi:AfsR/SARP family transcriptional regulator [Actinomadura parmotrematis]|uniref:AfsR/SARP family transcriptional regulator n=1 Tax=Actinomadura parmotrematis TaxID=2864039 RepID=UPI0027E2F0C7|nr:BTAD domain-containing putative transcriptional regulator [Actinomadura parmotrematis]
MGDVGFAVLGPVGAARDGAPLELKGPRHRAVLARLIVARGRVVPLDVLIGDLWDEPPAGAAGAVQTFVGALRRALEPDRPPRAPARLLVTEGPGYALRAAPDAVDAWRFERAVAAPPSLHRLQDALDLWRGPAYADFADADWAVPERARLAELRLRAVERLAEARLAAGLAAEAVPDLDAHAAAHPWREEGWRLLALALYRTGRQGDALAVLRRARAALAEGLGVDPGAPLRRLEADILAHDPGLETAASRLWTRAAAAYDRTVAAGARVRLESTVGLIRDLAVTGGGGLAESRTHRLAAVEAAEETGDAELTARVIGTFDVPALWPRSDDPALAARIVTAAERTLAALTPGSDAARCRLLATVAVESRGTRSPRGPAAAREAERLARALDDPALLAFALNGRFMQSCTRAGMAPERDAIGAELVALAARHALPTYEVLGRLVRLQARSALADFAAASEHADAADRLADRHELPLARVFTAWYRAMRAPSEDAYRAADALLDGAGMPGVRDGLLPLALLSIGVPVGPGEDWGPYRPWAEARHDPDALRALPEPPADLLYEALCCLEADAARAAGDGAVLARARARLRPAAAELAGAGSGMLNFGPVRDRLTG